MTTAIDTWVLLDLLGPDPIFGPASAEAVRMSLAEGALVACEVVWAEIGGMFTSPAAMEGTMSRLGLEFSPLSAKTAFEAGIAWKAYRSRGGARTRVAADFLIGAHALCQTDRLLTRDRGFCRAYFKHLPTLDPSKKA